LYADLKKEVYVRQPESFEVGGRDKVLKLLKSLYGLKQDPYEFNKLINDLLVKTGRLDKAKADYCLYYGRSEDGR